MCGVVLTCGNDRAVNVLLFVARLDDSNKGNSETEMDSNSGVGEAFVRFTVAAEGAGERLRFVVLLRSLSEKSSDEEEDDEEERAAAAAAATWGFFFVCFGFVASAIFFTTKTASAQSNTHSLSQFVK